MRKELIYFMLDKDGYLKKAISEDAGEDVLKFISDQIDLTKSNTTILTLRNKFFRENSDSQVIKNIVNLSPINQHKNINEYFQSINLLLQDNGIYIGCYEDYINRKKRISKKYHSSIHRLVRSFDFMFHRVIPKISFTQKIYHRLPDNKNYAISKAETLGRLCYNGFEILTDQMIGELSYFAVVKTGKPRTEKNVSYGPLFKMSRVSKNGKIIGVYKLRTMHPYSEYLQDYVVKTNGYNKTGKPDKDFRLTEWSRIIRKYYLDEIPQLINVLKGELNIVGVRPLSKFGFESLPKDLQKERIKFKPGCIPPNVALGLTGFFGVIWAERLYLRRMKINSFLTNFKFFWMAIFKIIKNRSSSS